MPCAELNEARVLMDKSLRHFQDQLTAIRWGSITPSVIDSVRVCYHGQPTPIGHLAHTMRDDNRIAVKPFDPQLLGDIDRSLKAAGFHSYIYSKTTVVVNTPKVHNQAERDQVIAHVRKLAEEARVAIRNIRRKIRQKVSKGDMPLMDKPLQAKTDEYIATIDRLVEVKVASL
jgi:ribosome recycling factor